MTNNNKRGAAIEALRRSICIPNLEERVSATVDAIISIVDARIGYAGASTRPSEPRPAEVAPANRDLGCITSPFVSRTCERGTNGCAVVHEDTPSEDACRVKMDAARAGAKCARGTVGCVTHPGPDEDAPSEDGDSPKHTAFCRSYELRRIRDGKLRDLNVDWRGLESLREGDTVRLVANDTLANGTREETLVRVTSIGEERPYPDGSMHYAATRIIQVAPIEAPSEDGEGPDLWCIVSVGGKGWAFETEAAAIDERSVSAGDRVLRYVPAARLQAAEASAEATRYAEAKAHDETLAKLADAERRIAELEAEYKRKLRTGEYVVDEVAENDRLRVRIAELEADNRRLVGERAEAHEALPEYLRKEPDLVFAIKVLAGHYAGEQTTSADFARELHQTRADLTEARRWIECGREMVEEAEHWRDEWRGVTENLERDLEQARAALKPFARHYEMMVARCREWADDQPASSVACGLTMGHCHDAYDLLAALSPAAPAPDKDEDESTKAGNTNAEVWHHLALVHGYNELAKQSEVLGEKVYLRIARDASEEKLRQFGITIQHAEDKPTTLVLRGRGPRIAFTEDDIALMRACVAEHDERTAPAEAKGKETSR